MCGSYCHRPRPDSPPHGANLFAGGYETERSDGLNDNYLIAPGDKLEYLDLGRRQFLQCGNGRQSGQYFHPLMLAHHINVKNVPGQPKSIIW